MLYLFWILGLAGALALCVIADRLLKLWEGY